MACTSQTGHPKNAANLDNLISFVLILFFLLVISSCGNEEPDIEPSVVGLVSYYTFENSAEDLIGLNDGIENNVEYLTDFTNSKNKTIGFNGVSSFVNLQSNFDFPQMTINLWFLAKEFDSGFDLIYTSDNPSRQYGLTSIAVKNDNGINNLYFNVSGQNITVEIETDKWYNVTIVRNNKEFEYYLNDELVFSGVFLNYLTSPDGSESAILGCNRTLLRGFLKGNIDDLRIYDRALSEEEVLVLVNDKKH